MEKDHLEIGREADAIIAKEVAGQDKMWGVANDRADSSQGQLLSAGLAQAYALWARRDNGTPITADDVPSCYPKDWTGFRDYGSDIANLAVASAFFRQEIKRLLSEGADTTRLTRDQAAQPYGAATQPAQPFPVEG
jgi:hypothetical protein